METRFYSSSRLKLRKPSELEQDDIRFICIRVSRLVWRETEGRLVQENMQKDETGERRMQKDETERKHQAWRTRTKTLSRLIKKSPTVLLLRSMLRVKQMCAAKLKYRACIKTKNEVQAECFSNFSCRVLSTFQVPPPPLELEHVRTKFSVFFLLKYKGEKSINDFSSLRLSSWCM